MDGVVLDGELGAGDVFLVQFRQGFLKLLARSGVAAGTAALFIAHLVSRLSTTRIEIKESVIYTAEGDRDLSSGKAIFS